GGSTVTVYLPASNRDDSGEEPEAEQETPGNGNTILIVDDEADVAEFIGETLRRDGFSVTHASSGRQALDKLRRQSFTAILSDLKMPGMDGPQLLAELEAHHPELVGSLGFMTGDTMSPKAQQFLKGCGRPYLEKPLRTTDLRDFVSHLRDNAGN
ncbi:MAG TPA: response regulator, partial [Afifellaceae bacterium]|nr:response regulator [Afifellaceae bacterium]